MDINNKKKNPIRRDSILESLRDIGHGNLEPNQPISFENREEEIRRSFERRIRQQEIIRRQEFEVFSAKKEEEKRKIEALQEEVIRLAQSIEEFNQEVKVAAIQQTVNPGVYHETFFEKLVSFIKSLRGKITESAVWLSTANKRARKQPYYWQQVRKSGTRFMLSQERYMATQAG